MIDMSQTIAAFPQIGLPIIAAAYDVDRKEGLYSNDSDDDGGPTNHGISLVHALTEPETFDLNHDGKVNDADIRLIDTQIAVADYLKTYFLKPNFNLLTPGLQAITMDAAVNSGPEAAGVLVQQTLNKLRIGRSQFASLVRPLGVDGNIGNVTGAASYYCTKYVGDKTLISAYCDARIAFYLSIIAKHPKLAKYKNGWINRVNTFR